MSDELELEQRGLVLCNASMMTLTGVSQPKAVGLEAVGDAEELVGDLLGDGAGVAVADEDAVDGAEGVTSAAVPVKKTSSAM
jgi:hypothetical protein